MGGPFDRTIEIDAVIGRQAVAPHFEPGRTKRNAVVVELLGRAGRIGMLPLPVIESNDRVDLFGEQIIVDAARIVTGVISNGLDLDLQLMLTRGFDEAVGALEREGEITFAGLSDGDVDGQIVTAA